MRFRFAFLELHRDLLLAFTRRVCAVAIAATVVCHAATPRLAAAATATRVLSSSDDRVVLEVMVPEPVFATLDVEGVPMTRVTLDRGAAWNEHGKPGVVRMPLFVGVPRGARVTATILEEDSRTLTDRLIAPVPRDSVIFEGTLPVSIELFERDAASYASAATFPLEKAAVVGMSRMRFQEYATIEIYPVRARAALREIDVVSRCLVEVRWTLAPQAESRAEKDLLTAPSVSWEPAPSDERWDPVYRGFLANPDQAAAFRERVTPVANPLAGPRKSGPLQSDGPEWKITVSESGLYRIPFESLRDRGFPAGTPVDEIRIFQRAVSDTLLFRAEDPFSALEIPLDVIDALGDGAFGEGDAVHVYLRGFREQFMPNDYEDMFAGAAAYWLAITPGEEGARMTARDGWLGLTGLTPPSSFTSTVRSEPDVFFNLDSPRGDFDLWFAVDYDAAGADLGVALADVDRDRPFRFRAQSVGRTDTPGVDTPHRLAFAMNGTPFASFEFGARARVIYGPDSTFAGTLLREGTNTLTFTGSRGPSNIPGAGAYLDWFEFDYSRFYRANGNRLAFTSGGAIGGSQFHIGGFGDPRVFLYDVTDPLAPVRVAADSVVASGGANELRFQAQIGGGTTRRYEAATAAGARTLTDAQLLADTHGALAQSEADHVMIVYDEFAAGLAPLIALRESQGMRVKVARLSDVYDEFGGGIPSPDAIRRYMKFAFTFWETPPTYCLLVGDGNEDHRGRRGSGEVDYVPSLPVHTTIPFESGDHWDASDNWYVLLDNNPVGFARILSSANAMGLDNAMEILIGRLSVSNTAELAIQVAKTVRYETEDLDAPWRSRCLFMADDEWITTGAPAQYCDVNQSQFATFTAGLAAAIEQSTEIVLDATFLRFSDFTDTLHVLCDDNPATPTCMPLVGSRGTGNICVADGVRARLTPLAIDALNEGVLFANYQGHGNRWVLSHESFLLDGFSHLNQFAEDAKRFQSNNRPFIFMAYGCSISEFERFSFNDDCLTEKMMNVANGGAVATFGSSGIEFLTPNLILNGFVQDAFLSGGAGSPPRYILGEVCARGLTEYSGAGYRTSMLRYILFGDPALRLRTVPTSFAVTVDGMPVEDGDFLLGNETGKPVNIVIRGATASSLEGLRIRRSDTGEIDPLEYPVAGDSAAYLHEIEFANTGSYDLIITAPAIGGGTTSVRLRVDLQTEITFGGRTIEDGSLVDPDEEIAVTLTTPLRVSASNISLRFDGEALLVEPDSLGPTTWRFTLPSRELADGSHEIEVTVFSFSKRVSFRVRNEFSISEALNYPNPLRNEEQTSFSYRLTADAENVAIDIYTVNGRKVRELRGLSGYAGYNPSSAETEGVWDGRDQDGDKVANGLYFFRVRAFSRGRTAEAIGKLVVMRGETLEFDTFE
ncbi:MAG: C25 family cysteine peptidase [bacterium]